MSNTYLPTHAMLFYSVQFAEVILLNFGETAKNLGAHSNINNYYRPRTRSENERSHDKFDNCEMLSKNSNTLQTLRPKSFAS